MIHDEIIYTNKIEAKELRLTQIRTSLEDRKDISFNLEILNEGRIETSIRFHGYKEKKNLVNILKNMLKLAETELL